MELDIDKIMADLAKTRDELKLKSHLMQMEAKDKWEEMEKKWEDLSSKAEKAKDAAGESSEPIKAAASNLMAELEKGYENIKKAL